MKRVRLFVLAFAAVSLVAAEKPQPPADLTAPPADAVRGDDGLLTKTLVAGTGTEKVAADDLVRLRYTVWKSDGTLVQDVAAPQSLVIAVTKMIPGWGASVVGMTAGERRRAWVPAALTAGKMDTGGMVIDSEVVEIIHRPKVPADVAAPPADATTTASGLAYKVLRPGTGSVHPTRRDTVTVHYTGWTTDGRMFDSSVLRGQPAEFPLDAVIKGWTEGLQLMTTGEQVRFWIPSKLAYANDKTKPQGMLVFDVELLAIKNR
ncbi:MAG TPA: FKBP-type peptidyl-prolyl cis-trans isomerase [Thermoanaerobaculia bacterium]